MCAEICNFDQIGVVQGDRFDAGEDDVLSLGVTMSIKRPLFGYRRDGPISVPSPFAPTMSTLEEAIRFIAISPD